MPLRLMAFLAGSLSLAACSPAPTCTTSQTSYRVCSGDQLWECPVATMEFAAPKLIADCQAGGQRCVGPGATNFGISAAACQPK